MASQNDGHDPDEEEAESSALLSQQPAAEDTAATETHTLANGQDEAQAQAQVETHSTQALVQAAEEEAAQVVAVFTMARQQQFLAVAKQLEQHPQHWTACDEDGHSLLHWASLVGNLDFVQLALKNKCPVDAKAKNLQTPLMWAALRGHIGVARVLLDAKADMHHHDSLGATALMIAVQHRNYPSLLLLMHRGQERLCEDADKNGCTATHWAAYKGDLTAVKLLDYFGADLQRLDNSGMLPVHRATCASEPLIIEFLVEKKADLTVRNKEGKTCLDIAEQQQSDTIAKLLRKHMRKDDGQSVTPSDGEDVEQGSGTDSGGDGKKKKKQKESILSALTKDKAAQKLFPVFWLVCVSLSLFEYIMDLRQSSYEAAPIASMLFELGVPLSVAIFFWVALGDPGMLPARTKGKSGVEELMRTIDKDTPSGGSLPDISRLCLTTWVLKDLRTKYCAQTGGCIQEFDHYCVWLNTSIGRGNHRQFYMLALAEWMTQLIHIYLLWCMSRHLVPYTSFGGWIGGVITGYPLLTMMALIQTLTAPWIFMLIYQQGRMIGQNITTNEMMNLHRYDHFWVMAPGGRMGKMFRNPFCKGSKVKNCMDFWWTRDRSRQENLVPKMPKCCSNEGCHKHGS